MYQTIETWKQVPLTVNIIFLSKASLVSHSSTVLGANIWNMCTQNMKMFDPDKP